MRGVIAKISPIVAGQLTLAISAMLLVAFAPPAQGRMLLVPLDGQPVSVATLRELSATPLANGPLPGSAVIEGERRLLSGLWSSGIMVLAAPAAICASDGSGGNL
jgi:hypothetical protein